MPVAGLVQEPVACSPKLAVARCAVRPPGSTRVPMVCTICPDSFRMKYSMYCCPLESCMLNQSQPPPLAKLNEPHWWSIHDSPPTLTVTPWSTMVPLLSSDVQE